MEKAKKKKITCKNVVLKNQYISTLKERVVSPLVQKGWVHIREDFKLLSQIAKQKPLQLIEDISETISIQQCLSTDENNRALLKVTHSEDIKISVKRHVLLI